MAVAMAKISRNDMKVMKLLELMKGQPSGGQSPRGLRLRLGRNQSDAWPLETAAMTVFSMTFVPFVVKRHVSYVPRGATCSAVSPP